MKMPTLGVLFWSYTWEALNVFLVTQESNDFDPYPEISKAE